MSSIIIATHVQAEQWGSYGSSTTALVDEYARSVHLSDRDSDGNITDADFIMWLADYTVGKIAVIDHNEDGDIDCADVQVDLEKILVGLSADYNQNRRVDGADIGYVAENVGTEDADSSQGDAKYVRQRAWPAQHAALVYHPGLGFMQPIRLRLTDQKVASIVGWIMADPTCH